MRLGFLTTSILLLSISAALACDPFSTQIDDCFGDETTDDGTGRSSGYCGDGVCNEETCSNCPQDCGTCSGCTNPTPENSCCGAGTCQGETGPQCVPCTCVIEPTPHCTCGMEQCGSYCHSPCPEGTARDLDNCGCAPTTPPEPSQPPPEETTTCGNGILETGETCSNCPEDFGTCPEYTGNPNTICVGEGEQAYCVRRCSEAGESYLTGACCEGLDEQQDGTCAYTNNCPTGQTLCSGECCTGACVQGTCQLAECGRAGSPPVNGRCCAGYQNCDGTCETSCPVDPCSYSCCWIAY